MNIEFVYNTDFKIKNETKIISWITSFCKKEGFIIDSLVFAFFNDDDLKNLNIKYLNHNFYTDVISFDESNNSFIKGNIAISVDRVKDNASTFTSLFDDELKRVIIHGVLHLMGYNDKTDEEKSLIRKKEDSALEMFHVKQ